MALDSLRAQFKLVTQAQIKLYLSAPFTESFTNSLATTLRNEWASDFDFCFVADGGLKFAFGHYNESKNWVWIGDGDSCDANLLAQFESIVISNGGCFYKIVLNKNKNISDGAACLDCIQDLFLTSTRLKIEVVGVFGGRRDHEFINFFEIAQFAKQFESIAIFLHPDTLLINISSCIEAKIGETFSVTPLYGAPEVRILGAEYSGLFYLNRPSQGLSNIANSDRISIEPKGLVALFWQGALE